MKTKSRIEVADKVSRILEHFTAQSKLGVYRQLAEIQNVDFIDFFAVFRIMCELYGSGKVRMYMSGELETEGMLIIYTPIIGCTIAIESEPCVNLRWKIRHIDININQN